MESGILKGDKKMKKYVLLCCADYEGFGEPRFFDNREDAQRAMVQDFIAKVEITDPAEMLMKLINADDCYLTNAYKLILWGRDKHGTCYNWAIYYEDIN